MFKLSSCVATLLVASVLPYCSYGILEEELTAALQNALAPIDPVTFAHLGPINVPTDHSDLVFNSNKTVHAGFSNIVVTYFEPPVPFVSRVVKLNAVVNVTWQTDDYTLAGIFNGDDFYSSGTAYLAMFEFGIDVDFTAEDISIDPLGGCIDEGSLVIDFTIGSITADFEGAEEISAHIQEEAEALMESVQDLFNADSIAIENYINSLVCVAAAITAP